MAHRLTRRIVPYLFVTPAILFYSLFFAFSIGFALWLSFHEWDMLAPLSQARFVGWKNYTYLFTEDEVFGLVLRNTLVFAFAAVLGTTLLALGLAFAITRSKWKAVWRVVHFLPMVTTVVAIGQIWKYAYNANYGLINAVFGKFGLPRPSWLDDPNLALPAVVAVAIWAGIGGAMLIFSAGLEGIPEVYYEAARIDGASAWREFGSITLPLLKPTLLFTLVTGFISGLQSFALVLVMTNGGPVNATRVLALYMYETAFQNLRMGRATAMVFVLFVAILAITLVQLRLFRRGGIEQY